MMFKYCVQTHNLHALFSEQFMDGLHLRNGAGNTPGTQHLEGAGDHHTAALRFQVNGFRVFSHSVMRQLSASSG